jgi:hypothetical protein
MKNAFDGLKSKQDIAENRISESGYIPIETFQIKIQITNFKKE